MSNLQPNRCLKLDFQKVGQHAGSKFLFHDTKSLFKIDVETIIWDSQPTYRSKPHYHL